MTESFGCIYMAQLDRSLSNDSIAGTKGMKYGPRDRDDLRPLYKVLAQKYRLVIYSGDADGCVPYEMQSKCKVFPNLTIDK